MKQELMKKFEDWLDINLKKGDVIRTSEGEDVIAFQKV